MVLQIPGGDAFATGAIRYDYRPVTEAETTNRIILLVEIEAQSFVLPQPRTPLHIFFVRAVRDN